MSIGLLPTLFIVGTVLVSFYAGRLSKELDANGKSN